ncbi:MAG: beta-galactosidase trimerization domain-containing protein [Verrucomicrobia bacterium]|nr:beta-galactosidase trimerization domain-containing protein [Verrucomicrobiota bacterium]
MKTLVRTLFLAGILAAIALSCSPRKKSAGAASSPSGAGPTKAATSVARTRVNPASWKIAVGKQQVLFEESGQGAARRLILENGYLRVVINPAEGGRVESFVHKRSGQELTLPLGETTPGGLLSDHLWQQDYWKGDWLRAACAVKVLEPSGNQVRVSLSAPGRLWTGLTIEKTITLAKDSSVLAADYTLSANDAVDKRCKPDFDFNQAMAGPGKVFMPTESGVLARPISAESEDWAYDPTRGWMGFVADSGAGLGAVFDFQRLRAMRVAQRPGLTMQWLWRKVEAKPGMEIKTPVRLAAFDGLKEIAGVGEWAAAELQAAAAEGPKPQVNVTLAPFKAFKGRIVLTLRPIAGGASQVVDQREISFTADQPTGYTVALKPPDTGHFVLEGALSAAGMKELKFEKPVHLPNGKGIYVMTPESGRTPEIPDSPSKARYKPIDLNFNSTAIPSPHWNWAKPYAGGRPKMLVLMPEGSEREAMELAQRFDIDLTCAYLCGSVYYALGDAVMSIRMEDVNANVEKTLERNFDVIIMAVNNVWPLLTDKAKQRILEMVKSGTGLVFIQRGDAPAEWKDLMPFQFFGYDHASGRYDPIPGAPPVLNALPYSALPISYYSNGSNLRKKADGSPMGQIILQATGLPGHPNYPLTAIGEIGKGRVVETCTEGGLIPSYNKFVNIHSRNDPMPAFDYWEYHFAMMARLIYWAARKETSVALLNVAGEEGFVKAEVKSQMDGPVTVRVTVRDWFGQVLAEKEQAAELKTAESQTLAVTIAGGLQGRPYLADVIISNSKGVLAFGGGLFPRDAIQFTKVTPEKPVYLPDESATLVATLKGTPPAGAVVRGEIWDLSGRKVALAETSTFAAPSEASAAVPQSGATAGKPSDKPGALEARISIPLQKVIGLVYQGRVALVAGGKVLDQYHCEGRIKAVRHPERYRASFWDTVTLSSQPVYHLYFRFLRGIGINGGWASSGDTTALMEFLRRFNLPFSGSGGGMYTNGGVTKQDAAVKPVEAACAIHSEKSYQSHREGGQKAGERHKNDDILLYSCGDENRGPPKDICFCEASKAAIRKQLQEKYYKTIDDLNKEWGTTYKSFAEVAAMTEDEVKEHGKTAKSYAPWIDHLNLVNWATAELARQITEGVREKDPEAIVGESGSQEPGIYGTGRDWWWMSKAYTGLAAYGGLQTTEQESYNPNLVRYTWCGYGKPNPMTRAGYYNILGNYDKGCANFASRSHIDPDFTMPECGREARGIMVELKRGIGQMLVSAETAKDPVFVLQSHSSILGAYIIGEDAVASRSRTTVIQFLKEFGLRYQSISYDQLANGHLSKSGARVLVLPYSVALSPEEVGAIRDWVKQGGTLVADLQTAIMDGHGKMYPKPELDDVFGIDRSRVVWWEPEKDETVTAAPKNVQGATGLPVKLSQTGIRGPAQPLWTVTRDDGSAAVVFHNAFGQGHAYYFATDLLSGYQDALGKPEDKYAPKRMQLLYELFDQIMAGAGLKPQVAVRLRDPKTGLPGARCPWVWPALKKSGETRFLILQRNYTTSTAAMEDVPVTIQFRDPGVIYDVIGGKLLGRGDSVNLTMVNCTSRVFSVLPSEVLGVEVQPPKASYAPGEEAVLECSVKAASDKPDPRVFRVDIAQPDGKVHEDYSTDLICPTGSGTVRVPFALNDMKGDWQASIIDVSSGVSTTVKLTLK